MQGESGVILSVKGLQIEGFSAGRWQPIVKGVDLTLHRGEVLGLVGESGAGKSTLGLASLGLTRPGCRIVAGSVIFDGIDLAKTSETAKRRLWGTRLTYVAQSAAASFNPALRLMSQTVAASVREGLMSRREAEEDAKAIFRTLMLPTPDHIGERFPHQLSGGQLQRVMTAMAMSPRPSLIVFDEPTTALDVTTQVDVLLAMRKVIKEFNTAAIYITHDLAVVAQMADVIKVLRFGVEVEQAPTRQIIANPREDYTRSLWSVRLLRKRGEASDDRIIEVSGIDVSYGEHKALDDVTLRLARGRTLAIVGESGSGKSTVARAVAGLTSFTRGRILFNGTELSSGLAGRSKDQLRRIQIIYQSADTAMNPRQTVEDIIGRPLEFYHRMRGEARRRRVRELLEQTGLDDGLMTRLPFELSGGQKQRVCIARALAAEPDVMICDEITSALDQIVQDSILKLLLRLQRERGLSYLFITHDIATVEAVSDEVAVMHRGKVVEQGPKDQVLSPPYPEYTELLLSSVPKMDPDWLTNIARRRQSDMPSKAAITS